MVVWVSFGSRSVPNFGTPVKPLTFPIFNHDKAFYLFQHERRRRNRPKEPVENSKHIHLLDKLDNFLQLRMKGIPTRETLSNVMSLMNSLILPLAR